MAPRGVDASLPLRFGRAILTGLPTLLAVVPLALLASAMGRHTVELPWMDQWAFAPEVVRVHDGVYAASDLWVQHNEHRVPVTKLVLHTLAVLSGWDVRWEVAANFAVAVTIVGLMATTISRSVGPIAPLAVGALALLSSALQTSLVQWQNWTWGWQLGLLLAEASAVVVSTAVAHAPAAPTRWAVAVMIAAIAGALCNGTGVVLLGVAPLMLLALRGAGVRLPIGVVLAAMMIAAVIGGLYAIGWQPAAGQPQPVAVAANLGALANYSLTFLGGPITSWDTTLAWRWGLIGVTTVILGTTFVCVTTPARRVALLPWLSLAAFSIGAAALTAVGRLGAGMHTALLSRYATFAIPLWLAAGPVAVIGIAVVRPQMVRRTLIVATCVVVALAVTHGRRSSALGELQMAKRATIARQAATCIAKPAGASDACYRAICWDASWARAAAIALQQRRLGPWRPGHIEEPIPPG